MGPHCLEDILLLLHNSVLSVFLTMVSLPAGVQRGDQPCEDRAGGSHSFQGRTEAFEPRELLTGTRNLLAKRKGVGTGGVLPECR